jgi:hypothetical protein
VRFKVRNIECPTTERAELRAAVLEKYRAVWREAQGNFSYPVGTDSIARLAYQTAWLVDVPSAIAERFVGVGKSI